MQIWFVSDGNGFQVVRFTGAFTALQKDLFKDGTEYANLDVVSLRRHEAFQLVGPVQHHVHFLRSRI